MRDHFPRSTWEPLRSWWQSWCGRQGLEGVSSDSDYSRHGERICISRHPDPPPGNPGATWLVTCEGQSRWASEVVIRTAFDPAVEPAGNETQAIYVCRGSVQWRGETAVIV